MAWEVRHIFEPRREMVDDCDAIDFLVPNIVEPQCEFDGFARLGRPAGCELVDSDSRLVGLVDAEHHFQTACRIHQLRRLIFDRDLNAQIVGPGDGRHDAFGKPGFFAIVDHPEPDHVEIGVRRDGILHREHTAAGDQVTPLLPRAIDAGWEFAAVEPRRKPRGRETGGLIFGREHGSLDVERTEYRQRTLLFDRANDATNGTESRGVEAHLVARLDNDSTVDGRVFGDRVFRVEADQRAIATDPDRRLKVSAVTEQFIEPWTARCGRRYLAGEAHVAEVAGLVAGDAPGTVRGWLQRAGPDKAPGGRRLVAPPVAACLQLDGGLPRLPFPHRVKREGSGPMQRELADSIALLDGRSRDRLPGTNRAGP